jgi:S1-C subfamily serine protease
MDRSKIAAGLAVLVLMVNSALGIDPDENGVFRITTPTGAAGTAFVIEQDGEALYLATAFHVVESQGGAIYSGAAYALDNDTIKDMPKVTVVATDAKADLAVVKCKTTRKFKPLALTFVEDMEDIDKIDFAYSPSKLQVAFYGYASGVWTKTKGNVAFAYENQVFADSVVAPGQSGGPAVVNDKIVGVVSGGNNWYKSYQDAERNVTWPTRTGSAKRLKEILDWAKTR